MNVQKVILTTYTLLWRATVGGWSQNDSLILCQISFTMYPNSLKPNDDNMFKALLVLMCEELECLMNDKMNCQISKYTKQLVQLLIMDACINLVCHSRLFNSLSPRKLFFKKVIPHVFLRIMSRTWLIILHKSISVSILKDTSAFY